MKVFQSVDAPLRDENISFDERWNGQDKGLILAYENGRRWKQKNEFLKAHSEIAEEDDLEAKALRGELPKLGFYGGFDKPLKNKKPKYGVFHYLAKWQGLRGEDLNIDTIEDEGKMLTCTATGMSTIFTANLDVFK